MFEAVICVLIGLAASQVDVMAARIAPENPLRSVRITIGESSQDEFFERLRDFADDNAFAMIVRVVRPDGKHFLVQMWRNDIKVIGVNPFEPGEFRVGFYQNGPVPPPQFSIDYLIDSLRGAVAKIEGATFSEKE